MSVSDGTLTLCHSEPVLSARSLLLPATPNSTRDTVRYEMTISTIGNSNLSLNLCHHHSQGRNRRRFRPQNSPSKRSHRPVPLAEEFIFIFRPTAFRAHCEHNVRSRRMRQQSIL